MKTLNDSKEFKLLTKIVTILADYKFNSTQTETAEMIADRIISIVGNKKIDDFVKLCKSDCYIEERIYEEDSKDSVKVIEIRKIEQIAKALKNEKDY